MEYEYFDDLPLYKIIDKFRENNLEIISGEQYAQLASEIGKSIKPSFLKESFIWIPYKSFFYIIPSSPFFDKSIELHRETPDRPYEPKNSQLKTLLKNAVLINQWGFDKPDHLYLDNENISKHILTKTIFKNSLKIFISFLKENQEEFHCNMFNGHNVCMNGLHYSPDSGEHYKSTITPAYIDGGSVSGTRYGLDGKFEVYGIKNSQNP